MTERKSLFTVQPCTGSSCCVWKWTVDIFTQQVSYSRCSPCRISGHVIQLTSFIVSVIQFHINNKRLYWCSMILKCMNWIRKGKSNTQEMIKIQYCWILKEDQRPFRQRFLCIWDTQSFFTSCNRGRSCRSVTCLAVGVDGHGVPRWVTAEAKGELIHKSKIRCNILVHVCQAGEVLLLFKEAGLSFLPFLSMCHVWIRPDMLAKCTAD